METDVRWCSRCGEEFQAWVLTCIDCGGETRSYPPEPRDPAPDRATPNQRPPSEPVVIDLRLMPQDRRDELERRLDRLHVVRWWQDATLSIRLEDHPVVQEVIVGLADGAVTEPIGFPRGFGSLSRLFP